MDKGRRKFLGYLLKGAEGSLYWLLPMPVKVPLQLPGILRDEKYDPEAHKYVFLVDINRCIGCGSCCVADKREYRVPDGQYRTWVERYIIAEDGEVYVDSPKGALEGYPEPREIGKPIRDAFFVPKLCNMCEEPACVQVCPVGATFKTDDGFILIDYKRCIGCAYCVQACPYGVRFIHKERRTADKCTWCYHRVMRGLLPACVEACPTGARKFGDLKDENSEVAQILKSSEPLEVLKPDMGTKPRLKYLHLRQEVI